MLNQYINTLSAILMTVGLCAACSIQSTENPTIPSTNATLETQTKTELANTDAIKKDNNNTPSNSTPQNEPTQTTCRDFWTKPNPIPKEKQRPFIITYETYENNVGIMITINTQEDLDSIVLKADIEYDCDMDGIYEESFVSNGYGEIGCRFAEPGKHQIAMRGEIPYMKLDFDGEHINTENYNLVSIDQWGDIRWKYLGEFLSPTGKYSPITQKPHYPELKATDTPNLRDVCDMTAMFSGNITFNSPIGAWDVSHVENMYALFSGCTSFNQDISKWNVSNVIDMIRMFKNNTAFNQDISQWNVSHVKGMSHMFENCTSFDQDLTNWDVTSLQVVYDMFKSDKPNTVICPKCESLRTKILEKNKHLRPNQHELTFENTESYELLYQ